MGLRPAWLACVVALVVVYGSLIPFDFAWSRAVERAGGIWPAIGAALSSPRWVPAEAGRSSLGVPAAISDVLMNALLYLPLGVTLRMALRQRRWPWASQVGGAAGLALLLSWSVESLQGVMPARVASLNDVLVNTGAALLAALAGPMLWRGYQRLVFAGYCRLARPIAWVRGWGGRPGIAMAIAGVNALIIGVWYVLELRRSGVVAGGSALPFERVFELPYDLGVLMLGRALLVYAGIGCLLLLLTYTGKRRVAMGWVVLGVVLLAFAAEVSRAVTQNAMPDITGPLLALAAGALMTVTVFTFSAAVRRANRRHQVEPYDGPERRRTPHHYTP